MINLDNRKNIALVASAGTGKTFNLALRYINLLLNGAQMEQILCLTFTVKATAEMQERIIQVLNAIADGNRADFTGERQILCEHNGLNDNELEKKARPVRDYVLKNFSQMRIRTIDSFINRIISQFPFEAQVRPGFSVIQDNEKKELDTQAFLNTFNLFKAETGETLVKASRAFEQSPKAFMEEISKQQTLFENKLLSLPALAKKYRTDTEGFSKLIDTINKSSKKCELASKAFGESLLSPKLNKNQTKQATSFAEGLDFKEILNTPLYQECDPVTKYFKNFEYDEIQKKYYYEVINNIKEYLNAKAELFIRISVRFYDLFFREVENIKKARNVLSFADITMKAYKMLVENSIGSDTDYLYFRLDGKILHILIDEFQDTSLAQWKILEPLVQQAISGIGQQDEIKSFFYVGDPKQTLYRFRGGESRLFNTVTESYSEFITEQKLDVNYRSAKAVMDFANALFGELKDDVFKYSEQKGSSSEDGYVSVEAVEKDDRNDYILKCVQDLLERGFRASEIAVLTDTNQKADTCTEYLNENGIPARSETRLKLSGSEPFGIIMNIFEHIFFADKLNAFSYRMSSPSVNSSEEAAKHGFVQEITEELKQFAEEIEGATALTAFNMAVNKFRLAERFAGDANFKKLCDIATTLPATSNLPDFFESFRKQADTENALSAGKSEAVTVMTVHKSKGLEFEAVIIADLEITTRPNARNTRLIFYSSSEEMTADSIIFNHGAKFSGFMEGDYSDAFKKEEDEVYHDSLNTLYVAVTRAKRELYIPVKPEPTANTLELLVYDHIEIPTEYGKKYTKSYVPPKQVKMSKPKKPAPREVPEYPITEESTDFQGEIFGTALHAAIFLCTNYTEEEAEYAAHFVVQKNSPHLSGEDEIRIKNALISLFSDPFFKEITENADIFRERSFFGETGIKTVDFYTVKDNAVFCVDFKTGNITQKQKEAYIEQINEYAAILNKLYKKEVKKYLLNFVSGDIKKIEIA